jgi:hypothetical protein
MSNPATDATLGENQTDALQQEWEETTLAASLKKLPETQAQFSTVSLRPIKRLYTPQDVADIDFARDINFPGQPPLHARHSSDRLSRKALDDAAIRWLWLGLRYQSAFQISA